ncbi:30S ribosomal protein S1 [Bacillus sp. RG28]|uniref:30S ribosomal protein S1 n=1 Tax=Gottfriedia endophytica TaxID=2820819 RepID=A0A940NML8_9BACI|nr:30S ribosomal protein S1 [Gottfriedia endophytica]MBP0724223.1 30S ribosomal protein S1 [Gottfriedia endophytica]
MVEKVIFEIGDVVKGTIEQIEEKQAIVSVGGKVDGILPLKEISNVHIEKVTDVLSVGEELELKVIKVEEDNLILSKRAVDAEKAWDVLQERFDNKVSIEVTVTEVVNGGLIADVGVRGFIPASLVSKNFVEDLSSYKGTTFEVLVEEIDREKNRVILSHKAVEIKETEVQRKAAFSSLTVGQIIEGKVERITNFGAFVNVGGVDGLVHVSQLSHKRVENPAEIVSVGDLVKVQIISIDEKTNRLALSMKSVQPGPWDELKEDVKVGAVVEGIVKRLTNFGAFVEIQTGLEGLVHISQISEKHIKNPKEALEVGQTVKVKVLDLKKEEKRLSLSIKEAQEAELKEDYSKYIQPQENAGFQLGELFGEKLKNFKTK